MGRGATVVARGRVQPHPCSPRMPEPIESHPNPCPHPHPCSARALRSFAFAFFFLFLTFALPSGGGVS